MDRLTAAPFLTPALTRQSTKLRADLQTALHEMTTGQKLDIGSALRGDFTQISGIDRRLARNTSFLVNIAETDLMAQVMQAAVATISETAGNLSRDLIATSASANAGQLAILAQKGKQAFLTTVSALNTQIDSRAVFSGVASDALPLPAASAILDTLDALVAGVTNPDDARSMIETWFDDPAGYAQLYAGGAGRSAIAISPSETASLTITAMDPAFRSTLSALANIALLDRGFLSGDHDARVALMRNATEALLQTGDAATQLSGKIGLVDQQLDEAKARNAAESSALSIIRAGLGAADPYDVSVQLEDLQTRLDAFYTLTARLSRLSLAEYLR